MKNREKYADEIKNYRGENFCEEFVQPIILKEENCHSIGCGLCAMLKVLWLEEDYEEPEVDWSKVEVDTPILVRDNEGSWFKRHFAKFENGKVYAWPDGYTSWTAYDNSYVSDWKHAKLAEQEEGDE